MWDKARSNETNNERKMMNRVGAIIILLDLGEGVINIHKVRSNSKSSGRWVQWRTV